jgi:hypothetical protein
MAVGVGQIESLLATTLERPASEPLWIRAGKISILFLLENSVQMFNAHLVNFIPS